MHFSLKFHLRQHTPIIHFQHDREGATLRATEVKPKLDRYIWEYAWKNDFRTGKSFLVGYSPEKSDDLFKRFVSAEKYLALDYKLHLTAIGYKREGMPTRMPLYFGNMGSESGDKTEKHLVESSEGVSGVINCADPELLEILEKYLPDFFQIENFGTRQSKGFGSFELTHLNGIQVPFKSPSKYHFEVANTEKSALWDHIDLFYRSLRSGINLKGGGQSDKLYFKSLMFQYARNEKEQWDKRHIRLSLFKNHPKFQEVQINRTEADGTVRYNSGEAKLYRDMLGLSSQQSWLSYSKAEVTKKPVSAEIDRYKSPITFKPFKTKKGWDVYILWQPIPIEMKDISFEVETRGAKTNLKTPNFDLDKYLKFAFSFFNEANTLEDYVGEHYAPREVKILTSIYNQLSQQV